MYIPLRNSAVALEVALTAVLHYHEPSVLRPYNPIGSSLLSYGATIPLPPVILPPVLWLQRSMAKCDTCVIGLPGRDGTVAL